MNAAELSSAPVKVSTADRREQLLEQWPTTRLEASDLDSNDDETKYEQNEGGTKKNGKQSLDISFESQQMPKGEEENSYNVTIRLSNMVGLPTSLLPPPMYNSSDVGMSNGGNGNSAELSNSGVKKNSIQGNSSATLHPTYYPPLYPVLKFGLMTEQTSGPDENDESNIDVSKQSALANTSSSNDDSLSPLKSGRGLRAKSRVSNGASGVIQNMTDAFREGYMEHRQSSLEDATEKQGGRKFLSGAWDNVAAGIANATNVLSSSYDVEEERNIEESKLLAAYGGITLIPNIERVCCSVGNKIVGKSENGSAEWEEEIVFENVKLPLMQTKLVIELCSRTPPHIYRGGGYVESILLRGFSSEDLEADTSTVASAAKSLKMGDKGSNKTAQRPNSVQLKGGKGLWRNVRRFMSGQDDENSKKEMEQANSAATVAKYLMERKSVNKNQTMHPQTQPSVHHKMDSSQSNQNENQNIVKDLRLGYHVVPLRKLLPCNKTSLDGELLKMEKWFRITQTMPVLIENHSANNQRDPHALIEILIEPTNNVQESGTNKNAMLCRLDSMQYVTDGRSDPPTKEEEGNTNLSLKSKGSGFGSIEPQNIQSNSNTATATTKEKAVSEPVLKPGVVDFVAVVGPTVAGNLMREDTGAAGWVNSKTQPTILEQFPPSDDFHWNNKRSVALPNMCEWFCFPEGVKIWRGAKPPSHADLKSHFSFSNDKSVASFDACLNCATSFAWFLVSSSGHQYGDKIVKTYAAVVRFYAPAPYGIDNTQDDFGQDIGNIDKTGKRLRLWIPVGICLTSSLPIVGTLEAMLLRLCEALDSQCSQWISTSIHEELARLIVNAPMPISGALHCSIPFLKGERFHLTLLPPRGLPPLPHGSCISATCKLLGSDGIVTILAAVLTESKVLMHSSDSANLAMVAEAITALTYPFSWALPYVPVLPKEMIEFVEAPLSYIIGVPTCMLGDIDKQNLSDVVVIDLDAGAGVDDEVDIGGWGARGSKRPLPLPQQMSQNITSAVNLLLREEEKVEEMYGHISTRFLPRLDHESVAERNFRIQIALEVCGLLRRYQECLFFVSSSQPIFNRDRFLRICPALFDNDEDELQQHVNSRSKRFLSMLVNTQQFHQFLERIEEDDLSFFHEIMSTIENNDSRMEYVDPIKFLASSLQQMEDDLPTYRYTCNKRGEPYKDVSGARGAVLERKTSGDGFVVDADALDRFAECDPNESFSRSLSSEGKFAHSLLKPNISPVCVDSIQSATKSDATIRSISLEDFERISKTPWLYKKVFDISTDENSHCKDGDSPLLEPPIRLKKALGEKRFQRYLAIEEETAKNREKNEEKDSFDLGSLVSSIGDKSFMEGDNTQQNADMECIRLCLQKAYEGEQSSSAKPLHGARRRMARKTSMFHVIDFKSGGRDLVREAEIALRNSFAQKYLLKILSHRVRFDNRRSGNINRRNSVSSSSRLARAAFDCLSRLCIAMLEACREVQNYEDAYQLLIDTAGFYMVTIDETNHKRSSSEYMTARISTHQIFANVRLWERVFSRRMKEDGSSDYDAAVSVLNEMGTYGLFMDELCRFAKRISKSCGWDSDGDNEQSRSLLFIARNIARRHQGDDTKRDYLVEDDSQSIHSHTEMLGSVREWNVQSWFHPISKVDGPLLRNGSIQSAVEHSGHYGRCMVTALASFGSSIVASGAADGSVFVVNRTRRRLEESNNDTKCIRLTFGSEMNAVCCLATSRGSAPSTTNISSENEDSSALRGCFITAGTAGGSVRCWSMFDLFASSLKDNQNTDCISQAGIMLPKHRGKVSCIEVPSSVYRPNQILSGGDDGHIKMSIVRESDWQHQQQSFFARRRASNEEFSSQTTVTLLGHGGRVNCIRSAWHGDRVLSGGEDKTLRLWDIGGSNGKCLLKMTGHKGWVTQAHFWGENTLISASTDRTIALWDTRTSEKPMMHLTHHKAPISDLLVGTRSEAFVISAGGDGVVAAWDLRKLTSNKAQKLSTSRPQVRIEHCSKYTGYTHLARGRGLYEKSVISTSADGILKEWDILSGILREEQPAGHKDIVSCLTTFDKHENLLRHDKTSSIEKLVTGGTITASWDGTVCLRELVTTTTLLN